MVRNKNIDALRGVAILMVLLTHTMVFRKPQWDFYLTRGGWAGVDLFFVLSGFLISGLLFSEFQKSGSIRFKRFAFRRAWKIYPSLYAIITLILALRLYHGTLSLREIFTPFIHDVLFIQNYATGTYGHFWSLAVEEHFYVLLPLMLYFLLRRGKGSLDPFRSIPIVTCAIALTTLTIRLGSWWFIQPFTMTWHFMTTHLRLDSLMFGVLLSYWAHFHREALVSTVEKYYWRILAASSILVLPCLLFPINDPRLYTLGFSSLYLGFGGFLVVSVYFPHPSGPISGPIAAAVSAVGRSSYPIYIWHFAVLTQLEKYGVLNVPSYFAATILTGIGLSWIIERPTLYLRDRLVPADRGARRARSPDAMELRSPAGFPSK